MSDLRRMSEVQLSHELFDVRFHGRAGQGVVTASRLLGEAAILEGKWIHAFPNFGPERMGAPVSSFTRISPTKFSIKTQVYHPDLIVIIDPSLVPDPVYYVGLKPDGIVILNTTSVPDHILELLQGKKLWTVDGDTISRKYLGRTIANTVMLGALIRVTGIVSLEYLTEVMLKKFPGDVGMKNKQAIEAAFEEVKQL